MEPTSNSTVEELMADPVVVDMAEEMVNSMWGRRWMAIHTDDDGNPGFSFMAISEIEYTERGGSAPHGVKDIAVAVCKVARRMIETETKDARTADSSLPVLAFPAALQLGRRSPCPVVPVAGRSSSRRMLARAPEPMIEYDWPDGDAGTALHKAHCREDRCIYGCGCPCHDGVHLKYSRQARARGLRYRLLRLIRARR